MLIVDSTLPCGDIALEETLDGINPLRHLMHDNGLEGVISSEGLARSSTSVSELLTILPQQSHSVSDGLLKLSFSHEWEGIPRPVSVSLFVDASSGCGGLAWPAGQILASYLVQKGPKYLENKKILELGSGTGLVGLTIGAFSDVKIWITDQAPLLSIMNRNIRLNGLEGSVAVAELNWLVIPLQVAKASKRGPEIRSRGSPIPANIPRPDIILAADCVYFEPAFPLLVQTLSDLSDSTTDVLFCYKKRRKADKRFFTILKKKFAWNEVLDDPHRHIYNRESITMIRLFKQSNNI